MSLDALSLFRRRRTAVWATTYSFEPGLFDDYVFRSLGDPPINANILVDGVQIERMWSRWEKEPWRLRRINRDYLVRAVHFQKGAFHPKTYFLAGKASGTLLVGSGNLTMNGLVQGHEVFSEFDSGTDDGRAAIASWRQWLQRVIEFQGDYLLTKRWQRFLVEHPWLPASSLNSPFVHNLDHSILDQFIDAISQQVDELHVMAPFYDASCSALTDLLRRVAPRESVIYLPAEVSIDGQKLAAMLERAECQVKVCGFNEQDFVHAKLIGCISGDRGLLLSGSANCSRPALSVTADRGNSEVAILSDATPDIVRKAFVPDGWSTFPITRENLEALELRSHPDKTGTWPVRLNSVSVGKDRHVRVRYENDTHSAVASVVVGGVNLPLSNERSIQELSSASEPGLAVLVDSDGQPVSNSVPIDDEARLDSWLHERSGKQDVPNGLWDADLDSELGMMLSAMNRKFIFDIEQIVSGTVSTGGQAGDQGEDESSAFWEKFDAEMVQFDPRVHSYTRLLAQGSITGWSQDSDLLTLLEGMVARVSGEHLGFVPFANPIEARGASFPPKPNIQVRVGNVLSRWSKALADPRYRWIDIGAPIINFGVLLRALATCRLKQYLPSERIAAITLSLLQSFLGSSKRHGYLLRLSDAQREIVLRKLDTETPELLAAMVYDALEPKSNWNERVFEWQPYIVMGIEHGILNAGDYSVEVLGKFLSAAQPGSSGAGGITPSKIDDHMMVLATFVNDSHWEKLQEEELELGDVRIRVNHGNQAAHWPITLTVSGVATLRVEPRIVSLVNRALDYKKTTRLVVEAKGVSSKHNRPQRLSVNLDDGEIFVSDGEGDFRSAGQVTKARIRDLEHHAKGIVEILVGDN